MFGGGMKRILLCLICTLGLPMRRLPTLVLCILVCLGAASAQVEELLDQARAIAVEALETELVASPDQDLWRDAIALGREAYTQAPEDLSVLRFMARIHSYVHWHIRAWEFWVAYFEAGGTLEDPVDLVPPEVPSGELFTEAATELGFARYEAGLKEEALLFYLGVLEWFPAHREALAWTARILFEQARSAEGLPYWERLFALDPDDPGVRYYLDRTRERIAFGLEAGDAFQAGLQAYEAGQLVEALGRFEAALAANDGFADASVWAGRTSLELGRPEQARRHWSRALALDPGDEGAAYFLEVAEAQVAWGVEAAEAYYLGQMLYEQGDLEAAAESFVTATRSNPDYLDAWVWAARSNQETKRFAEAIYYWQGVLRRDPGDQRAGYFLGLAEQQLIYGVEAARAFVEAVAAFQAADFEIAEAYFQEAVEHNPEFAEAYGWLGRLYFAQANYLEAARYYELALALEPENDDYRYFMEESLRLTIP